MASDVRSLSVYSVNVEFGARLRQRQRETWICAAEGAAGTHRRTTPSDNSCGSLRDSDYQCTVRLAKATLHLQSWPHHMGTVGASHQPQIQEWPFPKVSLFGEIGRGDGTQRTGRDPCPVGAELSWTFLDGV